MRCKRCQCDVHGFRTLGDLRRVLLPDSEADEAKDENDGLCAACWAKCELCGLDLNRPLTDDQISAALSLPLTLPRPAEAVLSQSRYRLCIPCRALHDTTRQQQGKLRVGSLLLDGLNDEEIGHEIRQLLFRYLDYLPDAEIGSFVRLVAQGDMIKVAKAATELVHRHKQA